ncbi:MAG: hypothetical protein H7276_19260, partial [Caulobacter sp.]|nr:hypothetical protein [Vitreoscilla sp.]
RLEPAGHAAPAWGRPPAGSALRAVRLPPGDGLPVAGDAVCLRPQPGRVHAFDPNGLAHPPIAAPAASVEEAATQPA